MGMSRGFLEYKKKDFLYKDVAERLCNFHEFLILQPQEEIKKQGARCMDCGIPYCHVMGCPVYNLIPEWNDLVYHGKWREAYERLELTNNLPEITGRICPAPCQTACTLSINSSPVTIKQIELAIIEEAFTRGWVKPHPPLNQTGKKVAIIGSGPAGLSAAQGLRRKGHKVIVFEKENKVGGLLRYGIPDFKLEKWVIDRRIEQMKAEGIEFETDVHIGEDLSVRYLKKSFDAIFIAAGAGEPRDLNIPGRGLEGIHFAMEYLTKVNKYLAGDLSENDIISAKKKTVLVIGGGDTGSDCVGTANRQGAKKVYQYEILPEPKLWQEDWNPEWPFWPAILRTSSAHEEGCEREWSILTKRFLGRGIHVKQAYCTRVQWIPDKKATQTKMEEIPDSEFILDVDLVLLATGFVHVEHSKLLKDLMVQLDKRGNIKVTKEYSTSCPGVFAAGDAVTGASLVVRAIYNGRQAALQVDEYLKSI